MVKQHSFNDISLLEKVLINWATPVEGMILWPIIKLGLKADLKYEKFFNDYGIIIGLWKAKINDYERLLNNISEDGISNNVLKLYDGTPCGYGMKLIYKTLR
ncbi:MAG: hypothetical protein ACOYT4_03965 [Nanoarchaeota archaeon]